MATRGNDGRQKTVVSPSFDSATSCGLGSRFMTLDKYERREKTLQRKVKKMCGGYFVVAV